MNDFISIAIDGPAGSGKTTIAKILASKLNFIHFNTGSMYRSMAYYFVKNNLNFENKSIVINHIDKISIDIEFENGQQKDFLNGEYVTPFLRDEKVSYASSLVSQYKIVRQKAVYLQRKVAEKINVIMEGRDIGSFVLPKAQYKIFLTASNEERANRRFLQLKEKGEKPNFEQILSSLKERDERDSLREISPLVKASDAIEIDTTNMSIEEVVNSILKIIKK